MVCNIENGIDCLSIVNDQDDDGEKRQETRLQGYRMWMDTTEKCEIYTIGNDSTLESASLRCCSRTASPKVSIYTRNRVFFTKSCTCTKDEEQEVSTPIQ